jgi:hypothetical protein
MYKLINYWFNDKIISQLIYKFLWSQGYWFIEV